MSVQKDEGSWQTLIHTCGLTERTHGRMNRSNTLLISFGQSNWMRNWCHSVIGKLLSYCNVWLPLLEFYSGHMYNNDKKQTDSFMIPKKKTRRDILKSQKTEEQRPGCCSFSKPLVQQEKSRVQTEAIFSCYILTSCHNKQCNLYPLKSHRRE